MMMICNDSINAATKSNDNEKSFIGNDATSLTSITF